MKLSFLLRCGASVLLVVWVCPVMASNEKSHSPVPIILDTDIGSDIDDTWALLQAARSPELDLKLVLCGTGDTVYRARVAAKFLEAAGRAEVPIGLGPNSGGGKLFQEPWLDGYELEDYPGPVERDGVGALIELAHASPTPITLIAIGPLPNIVEALRRDPSIAPKLHFIGMFGAIDRGYNGRPPPEPEYNVYGDVSAFRTILAADWASFSITPLDTCGIVRLGGEPYQDLCKTDDAGVRALFENYAIWKELVDWENAKAYFPVRSSTLFDTVAIYMAYDGELLEFEDFRLSVDDAGLTFRDPVHGRPVRAAMRWKDLDAYYAHLAARLAGNVP